MTPKEARATAYEVVTAAKEHAARIIEEAKWIRDRQKDLVRELSLCSGNPDAMLDAWARLLKENEELRSENRMLKHEPTYVRRAKRSGSRRVGTKQRRLRERAKITYKLRFQVFERDAYRCRYCGRHLDALDCASGEHLVIEHVVPIANGGTSDLSNLVTACNTCNAGKGTKPTSRFAETSP